MATTQPNPEGIMHDSGGHSSGSDTSSFSSDTSSFSSHHAHSSHTSAGISAGQYYPSQNPNDPFYPVQNSSDQFYPVQNSNDLNYYAGGRRRGPSPLVVLLVVSILLPIVFLVIGLSSFF